MDGYGEERGREKKHTSLAAEGLDFELIEGNEFSSNRS